MTCRPSESVVPRESFRGRRVRQAGQRRWSSFSLPCHPASLHAGDHAEIVSRTATMRKLIAAGDGIAEPGYGDAGDPEPTLRQAEDTVCALRNATRQREFQSFPDIFDRHLQDRASAADLLTPNRQE